MAMVNAAPALKPTRMLSLISFTSTLSRKQPGDQAKRGDGEGGEAGDLRVALRVAVRHRSDRCGNHQRDGGGGSDRQLT